MGNIAVSVPLGVHVCVNAVRLSLLLAPDEVFVPSRRRPVAPLASSLPQYLPSLFLPSRFMPSRLFILFIFTFLISLTGEIFLKGAD